MADPPGDYVAYWPMDGNLNPSGGTPTGSPTYVTGQVGSALSLANSTGSLTQYITLSGTILTAAQIQAGWSVTAWVQDADPGTSHGGSSGHHFLSIYADSQNYVQVGAQTTVGVSGQCRHANTLTGVDQSPAVRLSTSVWTHLAYVWNGSAMTIYKGGSAVGSGAATHGSAPTASLIGADLVSSGVAYWWGLIDELRVYAYALTAPQVADCYNYAGVVGPQTWAGAATEAGVGVLTPAPIAILQATTLIDC